MPKNIYIAFRGDGKLGGVIAEKCYGSIHNKCRKSCYFSSASDRKYGENYRKAELAALETAEIFLLVLTPDIFLNICDEKDEVGFELRTAIKKSIKIKAIASEDFYWDDRQRNRLKTFLKKYFPEKAVELLEEFVALDYVVYKGVRQYESVEKKLLEMLSLRKAYSVGRADGDDIDLKTLKEGVKIHKMRIDNKDSLSIPAYVRKCRHVYFPVVPRVHIGTLHLTFINIIKSLEDNGLIATVFIFDDYYRRITNNDPEDENTLIENFIDNIIKLGIKEESIVRESSIMKKSGSGKVMKCLFDLASSFSIAQIKTVNSINAYLRDDTKFIRFLKPLLNMMYLDLLKCDFGFVLCGEDEVEMWKSYINIIARGDRQSMAIFSIPKMANLNGECSNIMDNCNYFANTMEDIIEKVARNLSDVRLLRADCGLFYLLDHNYFIKDEAEIVLSDKQGNESLIKSVDELIEWLKINGTGEEVINEIAKIIYNLFNMEE